MSYWSNNIEPDMHRRRAGARVPTKARRRKNFAPNRDPVLSAHERRGAAMLQQIARDVVSRAYPPAAREGDPPAMRTGGLRDAIEGWCRCWWNPDGSVGFHGEVFPRGYTTDQTRAEDVPKFWAVDAKYPFRDVSLDRWRPRMRHYLRNHGRARRVARSAAGGVMASILIVAAVLLTRGRLHRPAPALRLVGTQATRPPVHDAVGFIGARLPTFTRRAA